VLDDDVELDMVSGDRQSGQQRRRRATELYSVDDLPRVTHLNDAEVTSFRHLPRTLSTRLSHKSFTPWTAFCPPHRLWLGPDAIGSVVYGFSFRFTEWDWHCFRSCAISSNLGGAILSVSYAKGTPMFVKAEAACAVAQWPVQHCCYIIYKCKKLSFYNNV